MGLHHESYFSVSCDMPKANCWAMLEIETADEARAIAQFEAAGWVSIVDDDGDTLWYCRRHAASAVQPT